MTFAPAQRRDQSPDKPAVRAAIANGDAVANGKIVAGDDMFVDHYRVTMMDSEPPTNGRGGLDFIPEQAFRDHAIQHQHRRGPQIIQHILLRQTEQNERYGRPAPCNRGVSSSYSRVSLPASLSPRSPAAAFAVTHGESNVSNVRRVIRLLRIWYRVKAGIFLLARSNLSLCLR